MSDLCLLETHRPLKALGLPPSAAPFEEWLQPPRTLSPLKPLIESVKSWQSGAIFPSGLYYFMRSRSVFSRVVLPLAFEWGDINVANTCKPLTMPY